MKNYMLLIMTLYLEKENDYKNVLLMIIYSKNLSD
jgi:hypothetical protein